jgi:sulfur relay (sulfurtransferase) DsrF/TusC family protein
MAQRRIVFTINRPPVGSVHFAEGLRATVGATAGTDEHEVDVLYLGDGVYFALKNVDRTDTAKYIETLSQGGRKLKVEQESLDERGISRDALAGDMEVISRAAALKLIAGADFTAAF